MTKSLTFAASVMFAVAASWVVSAPVALGQDAGAPDAGTADAGATPDAGAVNGTVNGTVAPPATAEEGSATPWAGTSDVPPPAFLDTTDTRIRDERPAPPAAQVAALREMEAEVLRYRTVGGSYRDTVLGLVRREYLRQRRARDQAYARQIREEERLQNEARDRAIRLFEQFIARYPSDAQYTPDAMFRLGELYFERSATVFQDAYLAAQDARDRGETPPPVGDMPDFWDTVRLYQTLVSQFPDYRRLDGVYYLIGYCLNEMAEAEEARMAWLSLVCHNNFTYDPVAFATERRRIQCEDLEAARDAGEDPPPGSEHLDCSDLVDPPDQPPAVTLDGDPEEEEEEEVAYVDPYADCQPVTPEAEFISETWFRIGEYHFDDYGADNALELAISAYNRILSNPEDRNYNLALYKVAWAYYRASRYPEAIRHFGLLVQWSDDEEARTGSAGSELRPEAVQYLGIAFAYDDWDENQMPDPLEGLPTGIQRVQDPDLIPQDREWTAEVYFHLGQVYFEENRLDEAIAVWELALSLWPNHARAPEITNMIARAYTRKQEMEEAIRYRAMLGNYGEGSAWEQANLDNPTELRTARELAENALIGTAIHYHQEAQRLRSQCVTDQNPELCTRAQASYALAAQAYRGYLTQYPNNPQAYELRYNLADALYWSGDYETSAVEYAAVRDSNLDDQYLSESARRVVESLKKILDAAVEAGSVTVRDEPPAPTGTPLRVIPVEMPQLVQRIAQAREMYLARVDESEDEEGVRADYDFNNAILLYAYGYWTHAIERFNRIFDERCTGPNANDTGRVAWINLRNMAVALQNDDEVERLATQFNERGCTFQPGATTDRVDCSQPENRDEPACIVEGDINALIYRRALATYAEAESAEGDEQRRLYEQAATMLVQAVNDNPNDTQAPAALERAAVALERTSRFESAARLYQRIIDEVGPRQAADDAEQAALDAILANAHYRIGLNAAQFYDFDRAVENYRLLADSRRFAGSSDPLVIEKREFALVNAAIILRNQQQYAAAAEYYRRASETSTDSQVQRDALFQVAEMSFKQRNWTQAIRDMQAFISRYERDTAAGELVVRAYWRIAEARQNARARDRDYQAALQNVVNSFSRSGQAPGSLAAEYGAHARFVLVDTEIEGFESYTVNPGRPATMNAYIQTITSQFDSGATRAQEIVDGYEPVLGYARPVWTIAAYVRQGRAYEILARGILNTEFVMPTDLQRQMRALPLEDRDQIQLEVEGTIQGTLDERVRPMECFAVARYALATRVARAGSIDNEYTRIATDRLQAYGDERIAECIAEAQRNDPSFEAYQTGEFSRAPRGRTLEMPTGVSPPSLAREEGR